MRKTGSLTMAEYFRTKSSRTYCYLLTIFSDLCKRVLKYRRYGSNVLSGRWIPADLATEMGELQDDHLTNAGSITSIQAVYVPADDLT